MHSFTDINFQADGFYTPGLPTSTSLQYTEPQQIVTTKDNITYTSIDSNQPTIELERSDPPQDDAEGLNQPTNQPSEFLTDGGHQMAHSSQPLEPAQEVGTRATPSNGLAFVEAVTRPVEGDTVEMAPVQMLPAAHEEPVGPENSEESQEHPEEPSQPEVSQDQSQNPSQSESKLDCGSEANKENEIEEMKEQN